MKGDPSMNIDSSERVQHPAPVGAHAGEAALGTSQPEAFAGSNGRAIGSITPQTQLSNVGSGANDQALDRVTADEGGRPLLMLLRSLEMERLPWMTNDVHQVGRVRKLHRLDMVVAIYVVKDFGVTFARVLAISKLGRSVLAIDAKPKRNRTGG